MMEFSPIMMTIAWSVLLIAALVIEAVTVQLVSAWFAVGALSGLIANLCGLHIGIQVALFVVVSAICIIVTRPLAKRATASKIQRTNAYDCIGTDAIVLEDIDNLQAIGQVKVMGNVWTARSDDGQPISKGETVTILRIEGVKLIVQRKVQNEK